MKTKRQLRAEAVERLRNTQLNTGNAVKKLAKAVGAHWNSDNTPASIGGLQARLIYLLTDNDASAESAAQDMDNGICVHMCPNDSREKLEEIAWEYAASYAGPYDCEAMAEAIIELLDRQDAITRAEWCNEQGWWDSAEECNRATAKVHDMQAQVDELTAERDELREKLRIEREAVEACNGCDIVDELTAERDEYREKLGKALDLAHEIGELMP